MEASGRNHRKLEVSDEPVELDSGKMYEGTEAFCHKL